MKQAESSVAQTGHLWIATLEELNQLVADIEKKISRGEVSACYLDTEADSLHHFQEKLCLIQLAVGGTFALIDSLAISEMTPLLMALDKLEVWIHGADYDLTLFKRTYGWKPHRVRDTQIAARLVGHRQFGLASLIEKQFGIVLSKASQKADWSQRPLPEKMLTYAVDDVRWLAPLVDQLRKELEEKNRWDWFVQSCDSLCADVQSRQERDREEAWRVSGSGSLKPKGLAFLRTLWFWRDGMAQERDVPPFRVMNNQQMLAMATDFEVNDSVSFSPRWRGRWRETLMAAIDELRKSDPETWPQRARKHGRRSTEDERTAIDHLCRSRDQIAETLNIEPSLLGPRAVMEEIILNREGRHDEVLMPWQHDLLRDVLKSVPAAEIPLI